MPGTSLDGDLPIEVMPPMMTSADEDGEHDAEDSRAATAERAVVAAGHLAACA